jgi:intraflagellar transport protein 140
MAANYLQTLNWRAQPEHLSHILTFYTKAGAADSLAQFYLGCAQTELTQFRAYDKALQVRSVAETGCLRHKCESLTACGQCVDGLVSSA